MKSTRPIFKKETLTYQPKANYDVKSLFGKITSHLDPEIGKMLLTGLYGNENSTFPSGP